MIEDSLNEFYQNLSSDPRASNIVRNEMSAAHSALMTLLNERDLEVKQKEIYENIAALQVYPEWEKLIALLQKIRGEILESLVMASGHELLLKQVEARIYGELIELFSTARDKAIASMERVGVLEQQIENAKDEYTILRGAE